MKPPKPLKIYKILRGVHVDFYIGLPRRWAIRVASIYMFSNYYRKYINLGNIIRGIRET